MFALVNYESVYGPSRRQHPMKATQAEQSPHTVNDGEYIDLGGDITLSIGPDEDKVRLKVSKAVMCFGSSYFTALLGPNFVEGSQLGRDKELSLKEDDPKAFATICQIMHMKYDLPESPLPPNELINLAIVADKYQCMRPLAVSLKALFPKFWRQRF